MRKELDTMKPMSYKDYKNTIKLFNPKGEKKLVPIKKWTSRDYDCQPILPYSESYETSNAVGMVLERLLVIDLDVHSEEQNGIKEFQKWIDTHDEEKGKEILKDITNTMNVKTPSGGIHIYFMLPPNMETIDGQRAVGFMMGVDLLTGRNSYVPAPESKRADGYYKRVEETPETISIAPQWVIDLFEQTNKSNPKKDKTKVNRWESESQSVNNKSKMYQLIRTMREGFEEGTRNDSMTSLCGTVISMVKFGIITSEDAQFIVLTTAKNCNPPMSEQEVVTCWNSITRKENQN